MTILFRGRFEDGNLNEFSPITSPPLLTGTVTVTPNAAYEGTYGARCQVPAGSTTAIQTASVARTFSPTLKKVYAQCKIRILNAPTLASRVSIITTRGGNDAWNNGLASIDYGSGALRWHLLKGTYNYADPALYPINLNQWYTVELMVDETGGGLALWVDEVQVLTLPDLSPGANMDCIRFGPNFSNMAIPVTLDIDDCIISDQYIGLISPPVQYVLTIQASVGGTTNPVAGSYLYDPESLVSIAAIPNTGYHFIEWLVDGVNWGSSNPFYLSMNSNHIVQAIFAPVMNHTVTFQSIPIAVQAIIAGEAVSSGGSIQVEDGSVIMISVPEKVIT